MRLDLVLIIVRKELTETLRDRRTLMMMIILPVLLYPLIMIGFGKLQESQREATEGRASSVAVWGVIPPGLIETLTADGKMKAKAWAESPDAIRRGLESGTLTRPAVPADTPPTSDSVQPRASMAQAPPVREPDTPVTVAARAAIVDRRVDAVLVMWPDVAPALSEARAGSVSIYFDSVREDSLQARRRLSERLNEFRMALVQRRERERGLSPGFTVGLDVRPTNVAPRSRQSGQILGMILPFLLITMSLLGGFYPAIDRRPEKRARHDADAAARAASSIEIVTGKFLAGTISLMAWRNVLSLGATMMRILHGEQISVAPSTFVLAFVMLLPVTFFITAIFLALACFAKDFKDGQNFLTPIYMVLALPAGVTMLRGIDLNAWTAFVPVVNIALLIKGLLISEAPPDLVFLSLLSSTAYASLAVLLAARVFEREQLLLGGRESIKSLFGLGRASVALPSPAFALTGFALVLVLTFYGSLLLQSAGTVVMILTTEYGFFLVPTLLMVVAFRFPMKETLALRRPPVLGVLAAVLIGSSAWAVAGGVLIRLLPPPESLVKALEKLLLLDGKPASLWVVWLAIGATPALCEEVFFRGLVLSGLRRLGMWPAILTCALLFGVAHSSIYRLMPTMFIGLLLSWLVWRTGSIWTSIIAHTLNNGIAATLVYRKEVADLIGAGSDAFLSWPLTLAATAVLAMGLLLLRSVKPHFRPGPPLPRG